MNNGNNTTLQLFLIVRCMNSEIRVRWAMEEYADLTTEGIPRIDAFRRAFPGIDPFQWASDGFLSQYYNGPDRDYDID